MAANPYRTFITDDRLGKSREISAKTLHELDIKVSQQKQRWNEEWERTQQKAKLEKQRAREKANLERWQKDAINQTIEAERVQQRLDTILLDSLDEDELSFSDLLDTESFKAVPPSKPVFEVFPSQPVRDSAPYNPPMPFFTKLSKAKTDEFNAANQARYEADYAAWAAECERIDGINNEIARAYNESVAKWHQERDSFQKLQAEHNALIEKQRLEFLSGDEKVVSDFFVRALTSFSIPFDFTQEAEVEYRAEEKRLVVDYVLPNLDDVPSVKKVTYNKAEHKYVSAFYADKYLKEKYESIVYQLVLRVAKAVFSIDRDSCLVDALIINGYLHTIDESTGNPITPCVLTVSINRDSFQQLNLDSVDPKSWFRSTKGVSAASISKITPVAPLVTLNTSDRRFVDGYAVEHTLSSEMNLAAMDWQDFENLIRELFEEEYGSNGSEVKITQASRDGGVDAVVFDPDPIRGGKIIIQAKRYTNVVGVSAVRDLYGTVVNEGAMKGILVTTSYFGNDAYEFAQNKPLTLLDGGKLLFLLEKHGHKARIDLKEAKALLTDQS